jgi:hypothetical protein
LVQQPNKAAMLASFSEETQQALKQRLNDFVEIQVDKKDLTKMKKLSKVIENCLTDKVIQCNRV